MRLMKVLHITYDMRIGGTEMVIKNIIEGNAEQGIDMSIYCIEAPLGPWGEELRKAGVVITTTSRKPGFDVSLIRALREHIKKHKIDIVHCHQYTPWVYGALASAFTKTKVIFTEHGRFYPDSSSWKRKYINPLLLALTARVTAISKATKIALSKFEYIPEEHVDVVYNGIAPLKIAATKEITRRELDIPNNAFILGTIARLDPIKNQKLMIKAFANVAVKVKHIYLVIVGDGDLRKELESLTKQLNIVERVRFTGYKSNPTKYLELMDIFLLPSLSEGTSMTLLEAMSIGKPCIVTNAGGNPEIVTHLETGLVTENDNEEELTAAIESLIDSPVIANYSKNALVRFNTQFQVNRMMEQYINLYKSEIGH
tara:strand:- start:202 stop:1311 length:1110 start_codon:yes stop_codon:yes gene_type:complete